MKNKITKIKLIGLLLGLMVTSFTSAQITNNTVSSPQSICEGSKPALFSGSMPSGGGGSYNYQWQWSQSSDTDGFADIASATTQDFQSVSLSVTTWFRRIADDSSIGDTSNAIEVTVNPMPIADAFVANDNQCVKDNNFTFLDFSSIASGSYSIMWDFGDGNSDTTNAPSHSYSADGSYTTMLTITSDMGCIDTASINITANPMPVSVAWVNIETQCFRGNSFSYLDFSSLSSGTYTVLWNFGDGNSDTVSSPTHNYASAGSYITHLVLTSDMGCVDTSALGILVNPSATVSFSVNKNFDCLTGNSFTFADSSTVNSGAYTRVLNYGDGSSDTAAMPTYTYSNVGFYTASLIISTDSGCMDTGTVNISVNPMPEAIASVNDTTQCFAGNNFMHNDSSTLASGSYTIFWDFGDGSFDTTANPSHSYSSAGSFNASLTIVSDMGCKDMVTWVNTVYPSPIAKVWVNDNSQCLAGNQFMYIDSSSISSGTYTREWDFGDGNTDSIATPTHTYSAIGTYSSSLKITSDMGCTSSVAWAATVNPLPVSNAAVNNATQCIKNNSFDFTSNPTPGSTISWDFGDGSSDTSLNPSHTYNVVGNYAVSVTVTSNQGCVFVNNFSVKVLALPNVIATVDNSNQCLNNNNFNFMDSSNLALGSFTRVWDFGDGNTDTAANPSHTYASDGSFTASLKITNSSGCFDSANVVVTVNPVPDAVAWVDNEKQCYFGNNFSYLDFSSISSGSYTLLWDFGDGATDTTSSPSHSYLTVGSYTTSLILTSDLGCMDTSKLAILVNPSASVSMYVSSTSECLNGNSFTFADSSTLSSGSYSRMWEFGDGGSDTAAMPTYNYTSAGEYVANLILTTDSGCMDTAIVKLNVNPEPAGSISVNMMTACLSGNNFTFTDSSTIASGSYTRTWHFGDGNTDTASMPSHTYTSDGNYTVSLTLVSDKGCTDSVTIDITVNPMPIINWSANAISQCLTGNNFMFVDSSTLSSGNYTRVWDFGDGNSDTSANPSYTYTNDGGYTASLKITTDEGCFDSVAFNIFVNPMPNSVAWVNTNSLCLTNNDFSYLDFSSITAGSYTLLWDFGDGTTDTTSSPSHSYNNAGKYTTSLIIASDMGCMDTSSVDVSVMPSVNKTMYISNTSACFNGNSFMFADSSTLSSGSYSRMWDFGDGNTDTAAMPTHSYANAGIYTANLILTTDSGCVDTASVKINVNPEPSAKFGINMNTSCFNGNGFVFIDSSSIASGSYSLLWNFGDGKTDTIGNTTHSYTAAGTYNVSLKITSDMGCTASVAANVTIYSQLTAKIGVNNSSQCIIGNNFKFTDSSTIASGSYTRLWNFGNGITDTAASPSIIYATAGVYNVSLTIISDKGCTEITTVTIRLNPNPTVVASANGPTTFCTGGTIMLTVTTGLGNSYQWKRNGTVISGGIDTMLIVNTSGSYTVTATNSSGCSSTSNTITVSVTTKQSLGSITGNTTVNVPNVETYSVAFVSGSSYTWVVSGGNIISGQGSNAIQVQWSKIGTGFVKVVAPCYDTAILNISIPTGIAMVSTSGNVEVFPNPTNGLVTIKLPEGNVYNTIRVYDLAGKLVLTHNLNGEKQLNINLEAFTQGVYMIEMIGNDIISKEKIIVAH
ncbi:MAG: PKD domain-containing protein [Bacteroidota bacterium]|nr:PKD domain-containing protein [Bacteroidota bacterium]